MLGKCVSSLVCRSSSSHVKFEAALGILVFWYDGKWPGLAVLKEGAKKRFSKHVDRGRCVALRPTNDGTSSEQTPG